MKKLIITSNNSEQTIKLSSVDKNKFFVVKIDGKKVLLVPEKWRSNTYMARALDDSFAYGNGYGTGMGGNDYKTLGEWIQFFKDNPFYQLDTLKEVFEFAFE